MKGFYVTEAIERLLSPGMLVPFLLVPPLLAAAVSLETSTSSLAGLLPLFEPTDPESGRLGLALWNAILVIALISGITGPGFFSGTFGAGWFRSCLALPARRSTAFWSTALAHFGVSVCVYALTCAAIIAAVSIPAGFPLPGTLAGGLVVLLWTTAFSAFAGVLAPSWGAWLLLAGVALGGLALAPSDMNSLFRLLEPADLVLPPLGRMAARGMAGWPDMPATLALLVHAAVFGCLGWLLFNLSVSRGKRTG
jgi:hypothetical protein